MGPPLPLIVGVVSSVPWYGGVDALRRVVPEQNVERWLSKQNAYTLHNTPSELG